MLRTMILIREFDQPRSNCGRPPDRGGHPYVGEEAVAVGVCSALRITDRVTSTHRGHGHCTPAPTKR
jgi:pyruvate dehydrogenase E1 component alpha subunit